MQSQRIAARPELVVSSWRSGQVERVEYYVRGLSSSRLVRLSSS